MSFGNILFAVAFLCTKLRETNSLILRSFGVSSFRLTVLGTRLERKGVTNEYRNETVISWEWAKRQKRSGKNKSGWPDSCVYWWLLHPPDVYYDACFPLECAGAMSVGMVRPWMPWKQPINFPLIFLFYLPFLFFLQFSFLPCPNLILLQLFLLIPSFGKSNSVTQPWSVFSLWMWQRCIYLLSPVPLLGCDICGPFPSYQTISIAGLLPLFTARSFHCHGNPVSHSRSNTESIFAFF